MQSEFDRMRQRISALEHRIGIVVSQSDQLIKLITVMSERADLQSQRIDLLKHRLDTFAKEY